MYLACLSRIARPRHAASAATRYRRQAGLLLFWLLMLLAPALRADETAARGVMTDPTHPLLLVDTSQGDIFIELRPDLAPRNVARILDLATGNAVLRDPVTGSDYQPRYYDGMRFHRVIPGLLIQTGSPVLHPLGTLPESLPDEIGAAALGLDDLWVIGDDGRLNTRLNLGSRAALESQLLVPFFSRLGVRDPETIRARQFELAAALREMTLREAYELMGYRYDDALPTPGITRGTVALANRGPNSNGPEFFITVTEAPWLDGRHTVIGQVVDGMDVVERISRFAMDPLEPSRQSTLIFSIRAL